MKSTKYFCLQWLPPSKKSSTWKVQGWIAQTFRKNYLFGSFDKLTFISFSFRTQGCTKVFVITGFKKYSLISCHKYLYLFACALTLIYRRGSRLLLPKSGSRLLPQLLIRRWPVNRARPITYSDQPWPVVIITVTPLITALHVSTWDSNPALPHKSLILSQTGFL